MNSMMLDMIREMMQYTNTMILFQLVCYMSLAGTYVLLIVFVARLILGKCPKRYTYFLWMLVFLRFACPIFPNGSFSLMPAPEVRVKAEIGLDQALSQGGAFGMEHMNVSNIDKQESGGEQETFFVGEPDEEVSDVPGKSESSQGTSIFLRIRGFLFNLWIWLPDLWMFGAAAFLLYHGLAYVRLKRQLSTSTLLEPGVYEVPGEHLSFVAGFFHPAIYLSEGLEPEVRRVILCHERVHLRRKDYLVKPLALVISCIHWFNPFVWVAFRLMNQDMEISCDEWVLEELGERSKEVYSRALLRAADGRGSERRRKESVCSLLSFGENGVKQRIRHMLKYRRASFWAAVTAMAALVLLAIGLLVNPKDKGLSEKDIVQFVRIAGGYGEEAEVRCFARDYDKDGKTEAFVEIGTLEEGYIQGDFWFVSSQGQPQQIKENILMEAEQEYFEHEREVRLLMTYTDGNPLLTEIYGMQDGMWVHSDWSSPEQKYVENGMLVCMISDYDMDYDIEMEIFTGHTQKPYYFFYEFDGTYGDFVPCETTTITREDVKKYENGQEILWAIEEANPGCIYEYLLCENGMLYINRAQVIEDYIGFSYTACEIKDNRMTLLDEGEGCYRKIVHSSIESGEEEQKSFAERVAEEYSDKMWDPKEGEYRRFAEKVRHCLERDDVDGLYERTAEELQFAGDKFMEEQAAMFDYYSKDVDVAVFQLADREFFRALYESLFTPLVKEAIFQSDFNKIFVNMDGAWLGTGEYVLQFRPVEGKNGEYEIVRINVK